MDKDITCTGAGCQKCPPLPMIVLRAKKEVDQEDRYSSAGKDHDAVAYEEKAKHVVYSPEPYIVEDKVELDKDRAKREYAHKSHGW